MHKSLGICLGEKRLHFSNISKVIEGSFSEITDMRFKTGCCDVWIALQLYIIVVVHHCRPHSSTDRRFQTQRAPPA